MNIAIIGNGGREHAICKKISESKFVKKIFCLPGNAGTALIGSNIDIDILDFNSIYKFIKSYKINLVIVGPEEPLVKGIVDFLKKRKVRVFGPNKYAAKLEGSKAFMKKICHEYKIPTAKFKICNNKTQVNHFLKNIKFPVVVKADGLAAGKGVTICKTKHQVLKASSQIFRGKFKSSKKIVLEEFLTGEEASFFLVVDNKNFKFFGNAQDHKRVFEKDKGPNTGGMGAYSPAPIITKSLEKKIISKIVKPTLLAFKNKNKFYNGFLYVGLMIKKNEPYLIEYNIRMGDPECQAILPRLNTDLVTIINKAIENRLDSINIKWKKKKSMTVVLCAKGYPGNYKKNIKLNNINKIKFFKNDYIYHAGTKIINKEFFSIGGRVLNITSTGDNYLKIRNKILKILKKFDLKHFFFRRDIGWKIIDKNENYKRFP